MTSPTEQFLDASYRSLERDVASRISALESKQADLIRIAATSTPPLRLMDTPTVNYAKLASLSMVLFEIGSWLDPYLRRKWLELARRLAEQLQISYGDAVEFSHLSPFLETLIPDIPPLHFWKIDHGPV